MSFSQQFSVLKKLQFIAFPNLFSSSTRASQANSWDYWPHSSLFWVIKSDLRGEPTHCPFVALTASIAALDCYIEFTNSGVGCDVLRFLILIYLLCRLDLRLRAQGGRKKKTKPLLDMQSHPSVYWATSPYYWLSLASWRIPPYSCLSECLIWLLNYLSSLVNQWSFIYPSRTICYSRWFKAILFWVIPWGPGCHLQSFWVLRHASF